MAHEDAHEVCDRTAESYAETNPHVESREADLREPLPFDDARFDLVVCQFTLEHVRDWDP